MFFESNLAAVCPLEQWPEDRKQLPIRGGELHCRLQDERVVLVGSAVMLMSGAIEV